MEVVEKVITSIILGLPLYLKVISVIVAIAVGAYFKFRNSKKKEDGRVGACNNDAKNCRLFLVVRQMDLVRKNLIPFKTQMKAVFARDLKELVGRRGEDAEAIIRLHGVLVDAACYYMEHEYRQIFLKNNIPDANSPYAEVYYDTNYELVTESFWSYVGDNWIEDFFKLRYDDRRALFDSEKDAHKSKFISIIKEARSYYT